MNNKLFFITQNVILEDTENKILILRHKRSGKWLLPGGKIKEGEQWRGALKREIVEETGIEKYVIERILDVDSFILNGAHYYVITFICKTKNNEVKLSDEHDEYAWIKNFKETASYKFWHQDIVRRIKIYFKN